MTLTPSRCASSRINAILGSETGIVKTLTNENLNRPPGARRLLPPRRLPARRRRSAALGGVARRRRAVLRDPEHRRAKAYGEAARHPPRPHRLRHLVDWRSGDRRLGARLRLPAPLGGLG